MSNAKRILLNTVVLTASSFLMRTVSISFNVYLTNIIGAEGIGLFQLIAAVYATAVTFSVAGIKLASTRLVADSLALGRKNQQQIMKRCLFYSFSCGSCIGMIILTAAQAIAANWIGNEAAASSLRILSLSLPFVSMSAALNGYFTSESKILRYSFVQFAEQVFKIIITVYFIKSISINNREDYCNAIVTGISLAELFSLCCSYLIYRLTSAKEKDVFNKNIFQNLIRVALPDAIGSSMRSLLTTIEHILIPKGLKKSGGSFDSAIATYGIVHGMTLPIILYPSVMISSLSGLLVPEISSHFVSGQKKRIHYIIRRVLHLVLMFSIGTAGILFFNADLLSQAFYENNDCGFYIKILAPLVVVMYMDTAVDGMLKGLDQQMSYMKYNIIDAGSCVAMVCFLVPIMGVKGYILVIYLSEIINFVLSFRRLSIVSEVTVNFFRDLFIPLLSIISSCLAVKIIKIFFIYEISFKAETVILIGFEALIYILHLRLFKAIDKEETKWIRYILHR